MTISKHRAKQIVKKKTKAKSPAKPVKVTKRSSKRTSRRKPKELGEFGLQDIKNIASKASAAVRGAGHAIKERISPTPPTQKFQERRTESESVAPASKQESSESYSEQKLREKLSGGEPGEATTRGRHERYHERVDRIRKEREDRAAARKEKSEAWRRSPDNRMNAGLSPEEIEERIRKEDEGKRGATPAEDESLLEKIKKKAEEAVKGKEPEPEPVAEAEPQGKTPHPEAAPGEQIRLHGKKGDKYRVDQYGYVYQQTPEGKWRRTNKKTDFPIPKEVSGDEVDEIGGSTSERMKPSSREERVSGGERTLGGGGGRLSRDREESGSKDIDPMSLLSSGQKYSRRSGSGYDESKERDRLASFEKQGSPLDISSGYLFAGGSGGGARGSGYDERKERARLASFEAQGSSLNVGSGYIRGGSYKSTFDPEREKQLVEREKRRIEAIDAAGSPMSAGLGYAVAGQYKVGTRPQTETGKMDIKSSDVYSTGQFKIGYGGKKKVVEPQEMEPEKQIDVEMAKLTALQTRQAQLTQLQQIQQMQQALQPVGSSLKPIQPVQIQQTQPVEDTDNKSAIESLFGIKTGMVVGSPIKKTASSASEHLFGRNATYKKPPQSFGNSAVIDFYGLKYKTEQAPPTKTKTKSKPIAVGEFGGKKIKVVKHPIVDFKVYTPKNNLPETSGGFMGLFTKTAKMKSPNQQKKYKPTASEFLFGGRR